MAVPNIFGTATSAIPLSQLDTNFATPVTIGNTAVQLGNTVTSFGNVTLTNVTISSGNVTITGANVSGTANVSTLVVTGNQSFAGTGNRITGDFSNATLANRVAFQSSTTNGVSDVNVLPNGTSSVSAIRLNNNSDPTNAGICRLVVSDTVATLDSNRNSVSGTYLPMTFNTGGSERVRIDTSGNVGIGTSSPTSASGYGALTLNGTTGSFLALRTSGTDTAYVQTNASSFDLKGVNNVPMILYTNNTERMRIDTSGNLMVGVTSSLNGNTSYSFENNSTVLNTAWFQNANASTGTAVIVATAARAASSAFTFIDCGANYPTSFSRQFLVRGDGAIFSNFLTGGATTLSVDASGFIIRTPSDVALKTNVQLITYGLDTVMKLKPIKHDWVESIDMGASSIGFIAQDMELEVPEVVSGTGYKSIDYPKLTAVLTKAIQEQQALITSLTTRITALEQK